MLLINSGARRRDEEVCVQIVLNVFICSRENRKELVFIDFGRVKDFVEPVGVASFFVDIVFGLIVEIVHADVEQ